MSDPDFIDELLWFQYGGMSCSICDHTYTDVNDMKARDPVRSNHPPGVVEIACKDCFTQERER